MWMNANTLENYLTKYSKTKYSYPFDPSFPLQISICKFITEIYTQKMNNTYV